MSNYLIQLILLFLLNEGVRDIFWVYFKPYIFKLFVIVVLNICDLLLADKSLAVGCALLSADKLCIVEENFLGEMDKKCKYCDNTEIINQTSPALYFANKLISSFFCRNGKVILDPLQPVPELRNCIV